jgi:hypothetical protein
MDVKGENEIKYNFAEGMERTWNKIKQPQAKQQKLNTKNLEGIIRKFDRKLGGHRNKALS